MSFAWIAPEMIQRLAGSLLHFIWQSAMIAIVAGIGLRMLRRRSAEARYVFAIVSLVFMLAAPIFTLAFYAETGAVAAQLIDVAAGLNRGSRAGQPVEATLWAQRILIAWCAGVIVFAVRLVVGWRLSWQLVRSAEQFIEPGLVRIFESVRERRQAGHHEPGRAIFDPRDSSGRIQTLRHADCFALQRSRS